jgi:acyl-coenzyme A thioesterase PaaI-like protein
MTTTTLPEAAAAPTEAALRALCVGEHPACFACRPAAQGGLGLSFALQSDGSVSAGWTCPPGGESYAGIVHGGLLATALDSAMVHALFARGIVARTGELNVRFCESVRAGEPTAVTARLREARPPLFQLEAEIHQAGVLCARANGKFMAGNRDDRAIPGLAGDPANLSRTGTVLEAGVVPSRHGEPRR